MPALFKDLLEAFGDFKNKQQKTKDKNNIHIKHKF